MTKIKKLRLKNYCGYRDAEFDFVYADGTIKNLACFYGSNGCGKTSLLESVRLLSSAHYFYGHETDLVFRKFVYHPDYNPAVGNYEVEQAKLSTDEEYKNKIFSNLASMEISGIFETDNGDKEVVIRGDGVQKNELYNEQKSYVYYIDADHPMNMQIFQLHAEMEEKFLDLAKTVYGYDCWLENKCTDITKNEVFFTDFVIQKKDSTKVHYRRMSAGERKIATLLRHLCDPTQMNKYDIIIADNLEIHVYFLRHIPMIDKLVSVFSDKQLLITTHSGVIIQHLNSDNLYDVEAIKLQKLKVE